MKLSVFAAALLWTTSAFAWQSTVSRSPVDDTHTIVLIKEAEGSYTNRTGRQGRANIQILCEENRTGLAIVTPELYTSSLAKLGLVTFRIDRKKAFTQKMIAANDHGSLAVIGGDAIRIIKKVLAGDVLFVRLMTVNEPSMDIRFDVRGLSAEIQPLRKACHW